MGRKHTHTYTHTRWRVSRLNRFWLSGGNATRLIHLRCGAFHGGPGVSLSSIVYCCQDQLLYHRTGEVSHDQSVKQFIHAESLHFRVNVAGLSEFCLCCGITVRDRPKRGRGGCHVVWCGLTIVVLWGDSLVSGVRFLSTPTRGMARGAYGLRIKL